MINTKGKESKREQHSSLAPLLVPSQSIGRRSLSTLELECLSFTHQTICFIRFIFSPSDPVQPDTALMMKRRGHPCIISELAYKGVCLCVCSYAWICICMCTCLFHSVNIVILAKNTVEQWGQPNLHLLSSQSFLTTHFLLIFNFFSPVFHSFVC